MIKILDNSLEHKANINKINDLWRFEQINGENTLDFTAVITEKVSNYVNENYIVEIDDDYFDIAYYSKDMNENGTCTMKVECEHVSYGLNNSSYDLDYFTYTGTPEFILGKILNGTDFIIDKIEFTENLTYSIQEKKSRRALLMEFVALLGGEIVFNKFNISILSRRGSTNLNIFTKGKNIKVISKVYNGRENPPVIAYTCTPIVLPDKKLSLGDDILLVQPELDIKDYLRIVSYGYNPINNISAEIEIANYINGLEDNLYKIETSTLTKGKSYYGTRISPESGFESIRSDNMARTVMNADNFAMQVGDGTGNSWTDKLYFDTELGKYVFDGELSATLISALETIITPNLYAEKATISELTVDQLETGSKVLNYLQSSTADINYIKIKDQYMQFVTASTDGSASIQATNRYGVSLYWTDDTHIANTTDITSYPVYTYVYTEFVKTQIAFELENGIYVPKIVLGTGTGNTADSGKTFIYKAADGFYIDYKHSVTGASTIFKITDDGIDLSQFPTVTYAENVITNGIPQIWVQPDTPASAKEKDLWVDTDDYTRYDKKDITENTVLVPADNELIFASGTITITLHDASTAGIIKKIKNVGTGIITLIGTIDGDANMILFPRESVELITNGSGWSIY